VYIHPTYWIFLLLFTHIYQDFSFESFILGVVMTFSLLVHEYGHAFTALYFGASPTIILEAFGGRAQYSGLKLTSKQQFLITLNGPLLESLLIVLPYALLKFNLFEDYYIRYFLYATMRVNILWCLLNLIPIVPLDGGYLVRYLLEKKFGEKGLRASVIVGLMGAILVAPYLFFQGFIFFGALLLIFAFQHYQMLRRFRFSSSKQNPFSCYIEGMKALNNHDLEGAKKLLLKLLKSQDEKIKHSAVESLAKIYIQEKEPEKSYELLLKADHQFLKEGKCLLCNLAYERKNYKLVGKYSREIYEINPSFETALLNSKAFAHLNDPDLSGAWLETASLFGPVYLRNIKDVILEKTYDSVRDHGVFKQYAEKIQKK